MDGGSPRQATTLGSRWRRAAVVAAQLLAGTWVLAVVLLVFWTRAPALLGLQTRVVTSGSMQPGLQPGDLAVLTPPAGPLAVGDVVQVGDPALPSGHYLHRVVALEAGGRLVTRGDANSLDDPAVAAAAVDGRLVMSVPMLGLPLRWAATGRYAELTLAAALAVAGATLLVRPGGRRSLR